MIIKYLFLLIQFYKFITTTPHFNLHHTDWLNENEISKHLQHDCLYVPAYTEESTESYETISYCLTEWSSEWNINENEFQERFTFEELYQQKIILLLILRYSTNQDISIQE